MKISSWNTRAPMAARANQEVGRERAHRKTKRNARPHKARARHDSSLDFLETEQDVMDRQRRMVRNLQRFDAPTTMLERAIACLHNCQGACSAACHVASRQLRQNVISRGSPIMDAKKRLYHVTIVIADRVNVGQLHEWRYRDFLARISSRLRRLARRFSELRALGSIEVGLDRELNGSIAWSPHVHLVIRGATRKRIREAFRMPRENSSPRVPIMIKRVSDLPRLIGYVTKRFVEERRAHKVEGGRQTRRSMPLSSPHLAEANRWLMGLRVDERLIVHGMHRASIVGMSGHE